MLGDQDWYASPFRDLLNPSGVRLPVGVSVPAFHAIAVKLRDNTIDCQRLGRRQYSLWEYLVFFSILDFVLIFKAGAIGSNARLIICKIIIGEEPTTCFRIVKSIY